MLCESCGENEANVKLTQIINENVKKINLCEECAVKTGIIDEVAPGKNLSSFEEVLLGIGAPKENDDGVADKKQCPGCKMTRKEFRKTSRFGCSLCYEFFSEELESLLDSMQKGRKHVGKTPVNFASKAGSENALQALRDALSSAVSAEQYEEAARIRDKIAQIAKCDGLVS